MENPMNAKEWDEMAMGNARMEAIKRMEINGDLVPDCPGCRERYEYKGMPYDVFAPRHKASSRCQSGRRAHCTCDTCF